MLSKYRTSSSYEILIFALLLAGCSSAEVPCDKGQREAYRAAIESTLGSHIAVAVQEGEEDETCAKKQAKDENRALDK